MIGISTVLVVVLVSLLITRVATVVLVATGLSRQTARFQARSALSGTGFTTREAEDVVEHPVRRRVVMALMLVGNGGVAAAAGSLFIGFRGGSAGDVRWRLLELVLGILALYLFSRSRTVDQWLTTAIGKLVNRHTTLTRRDLGGLLQLTGDYEVKELAVTGEDWIAGRRLGDLGLRDEGIAVLGITRRGGRYIGAPSGATEVLPGDVLVVYGRSESLEDLDHRRQGTTGDARHEACVRRQHDYELEEHRRDAGDRPAPVSASGAVAGTRTPATSGGRRDARGT